MSTRLLCQSSLFSAVRVQPWTCAQCASFNSSAVAFKSKGKGRPPTGARGRNSNSKRSSRSSAKFGTTSRTRLVKDLKPKTSEPTEGGKEKVKEKGKFEVAPKRLQSYSSSARTPSFERRGTPHRAEDKSRNTQSKAAAERAGVEALLDTEFDRSSSTSTSKSTPSSNAHLPTSFASPPLIPGLRQSIQSILGADASPTPIQALALKHLVPLPSTEDNWREFLLASETGSGKSFAYLLPLLQYLKQSESDAPQANPSNLLNPRALVLAPTHELSRQLSAFAKSLVHNAKLRVLCASRANAPAQADRRHSPIATLGTARQMKHALSSLEEGSGSSEIEIDRKLQSGGKGRLIDVLVSTPVKALEMVRGWGWDKVDNEKTMYWEKEGKPEKKFKPGKPEMALERVECVVVDEADVLFDPDFRETTLELLSDISTARGHPISSPSPTSPKAISYPFHLILTSATIPSSLSAYLSKHHPSLTRLASPHLHRLPATLATEHVPTSGSSGQRFADVERRLRRVWAEDALRGPDARAGKVLKSKVLVFCNKSTTVERLGEYLLEKGIENVPLTSMSAARTRGSNKHIQPFLKGFEEDTATNAQAPNVLVTTSLLSRGLDFSSSVKHVFIFDAPRNMVDFLHRAGRAARAGEHGRVVVFGKLKGRGSGTDKVCGRKSRLSLIEGAL